MSFRRAYRKIIVRKIRAQLFITQIKGRQDSFESFIPYHIIRNGALVVQLPQLGIDSLKFMSELITIIHSLCLQFVMLIEVSKRFIRIRLIIPQGVIEVKENASV